MSAPKADAPVMRLLDRSPGVRRRIQRDMFSSIEILIKCLARTARVQFISCINCAL